MTDCDNSKRLTRGVRETVRRLRRGAVPAHLAEIEPYYLRRLADHLEAIADQLDDADEEALRRYATVRDRDGAPLAPNALVPRVLSVVRTVMRRYGDAVGDARVEAKLAEALRETLLSVSDGFARLGRGEVSDVLDAARATHQTQRPRTERWVLAELVWRAREFGVDARKDANTVINDALRKPPAGGRQARTRATLSRLYAAYRRLVRAEVE